MPVIKKVQGLKHQTKAQGRVEADPPRDLVPRARIPAGARQRECHRANSTISPGVVKQGEAVSFVMTVRERTELCQPTKVIGRSHPGPGSGLEVIVAGHRRKEAKAVVAETVPQHRQGLLCYACRHTCLLRLTRPPKSPILRYLKGVRSG